MSDAPRSAPVRADEASPRRARMREGTTVNWRHRLEIGALRGAVAVLRGVGLPRASAFGAALGRLLHSPIGIRRGVVYRQIRAAFPDISESEVERIARGSYEHLGRMAMEAALLPSLGPQGIIDLCPEVHGWEEFQRLQAQGKGIILVSGHVGNWELAASWLSVRATPVDAVARYMENPLFDQFLTETRERSGMHVVYDDEAVRRGPRTLRSGGILGLMMDQAAAGLASTWVPFFGRMAKTPRGPAVFALRLGSPMVFITALRRADGKFAIHLEHIPVERSDADLDADVERIAMAYTAVLERWVRKYPGQYFWQHRRWKHQQPGTPPELGEPT